MKNLPVRPLRFLRFAALLTLVSPLFLSIACDKTPVTPKLSYPQPERSAQTDDYFGVEVADPYRWFEDLDSPATKQWVEAENALAAPFLAKISAFEPIKARLTQIWDHERYGQPFKEGGQYFYFRNDGLQNQSALFVTESLDGGAEGRLLLDPNGFREDGTVSLAGLSASPNATYLAYAKSDGGSDWDSWHVRRIADGVDLDDEVRFTKFTGTSWTRDETGFFYSRYPEGTDGNGDDQQAVKIYYHRVGTGQADDELIYEIPGTPHQNPYGSVTDDGRFLVIGINREGVREDGVAYRRLDRRNSPVVSLLDSYDATYNFLGNVGEVFFFRTDLEAAKGRVIAIDLRKPGDKREVIPENEDVLEGISLVGGHLVAQYLHDAASQVKVFDLQGRPVREVELPGIGSTGGFGGRIDDNETFYSFTSFVVPSSIYRYDILTGESALWKRPSIPVDFEAFETEQVFITSKDGTRVPMFITHRKGLEKNGANPTLLYGYGGFNISLTPSFSLTRLVWLEMGGVLAIPNLRGGGEYGEDWHLAGTKAKKQNVFDDFISAAEWLINNGYTSTPKLAIQGGSNGGLLVGAALTQRPDLFGATLPAVGVLDILRYHTASANAKNWSIDYGLSSNEDEFRAQFAYSPVHNVREGTCYPPTMVTTADHDDRVVPWNSFKFGAALQHAQGCDNPILVRVETRAGHGAGTPTWMQIENVAEQWAFLVDQLGLTLPAGFGGGSP